MNKEDRFDFARYVIETVVEDSCGLMDIFELYDTWYDEDQHTPEIDEKEANAVLDLVNKAVLNVYWPGE